MVQRIIELTPWSQADGKAIKAACTALFASALGFFISVFAVQESTPHVSDATFAFDSISVPPTQLNTNDGIVSFYIPFYAEASWGSMADRMDSSTSVPPDFQVFLANLGNILRKCASPNAEVNVSVSGFASNTRWNTLEKDTSLVLHMPISYDPHCNRYSGSTTLKLSTAISIPSRTLGGKSKRL